MPCLLTFNTSDGERYQTIFKHGDDLRQDQLVLQIITLMDQLLRKENLDLKLTPYKVLATSSKHGKNPGPRDRALLSKKGGKGCLDSKY